MVEKELRQIQYKTNALTFQNDLCFKKTKALRVSSPKRDLSFVLKLPVVLKHLSASTEDTGIPSNVSYSFSKIGGLNWGFCSNILNSFSTPVIFADILKSKANYQNQHKRNSKFFP